MVRYTLLQSYTIDSLEWHAKGQNDNVTTSLKKSVLKLTCF